MYKFIKLTSILSLTTLMMLSCDLDKTPYDSITTENSWQTVSDAVKFENGIYSLFKGINGGIYTYTADYQSDLFNATISFGNRGGDIYSWNFSSSQYDVEDIWQGNYTCINNCNNIINNIDQIVAESDNDKATLSKIRGEAYLMRAICYHTLAVRFAKDYEPSNATTDLGLPLVLEFNVSAKPSRSTLSETYNQIKSDISDARKYLTVVGTANASYFNVDVIDAFESRVDLYLHNYAEAITLADKVIAKYPLISNVNDFKGMWLNDSGSEVIFQPYQSVDERVNEMPYYLSYSTGSKAYAPDFVPSKWVLDLYDSNDIRKSSYFLNSKITCTDVSVTDVYMLYKFPGNPALKTTAYQYYNMQKIFRSAECYLIAAEAAYGLGGKDDVALEYLNTLKGKRNAPTLNNLTGTALFAEIKNEWIREFVGEGQRLNDLKRWHDGFTRHDNQNSSIIMQGAIYNTLSVQSDSPKFVWEIPANDLSSNKNLQPNW